MRAQVFSDLHLDHASGFAPKPATDSELLIVAGDIGHSPEALGRLAGWPVPVIFVPGNHEYDGADLSDGDDELQEMCDSLGFTLLNCTSYVLPQRASNGEPVRIVGASRWWDFDLLGAERRDECMAFGERYLRHMGSAWRGQPLHAPQVRNLALDHREWLEAELRTPFDGITIAVTHSAPSGRSADPRYGLAPGTASFCNNDDDLLSFVPLWIHGHLHCHHDYTVSHHGGTTRVLCNPRGYERLGEAKSYVADLVVDI